MKKIIVSSIALVLCLCTFAGCGIFSLSNASVSVTDFEEEFDVELDFASNSNFTGSVENYNYTVKYSGSAINKEKITEFSITVTNINYSRLTSKSSLQNTLSKSGGSLTQNELPDCDVAAQLMSTYTLLGGSKPLNTMDDADFLLDAICKGDKVEVDDWTIKVTLSKAQNTATIEVTQ